MARNQYDADPYYDDLARGYAEKGRKVKRKADKPMTPAQAAAARGTRAAVDQQTAQADGRAMAEQRRNPHPLSLMGLIGQGSKLIGDQVAGATGVEGAMRNRQSPEGRDAAAQIALARQQTADTQRQTRQTQAGTSRVGAAIDAVQGLNDPATGGRMSYRDAATAGIDPAQARQMGGQIDYTGFLADAGVSADAIRLARGRDGLSGQVDDGRLRVEGRLPEAERVPADQIAAAEKTLRGSGPSPMTVGEMLENGREAFERNAPIREQRQAGIDRIQAARDQRSRGVGPLSGASPSVDRAARGRAAFDAAMAALSGAAGVDQRGPGEVAMDQRVQRQELAADRQSQERIATSAAAAAGRGRPVEAPKPVTFKAASGASIEVPPAILPPERGSSINDLPDDQYNAVQSQWMTLAKQRYGDEEWARMSEEAREGKAWELMRDFGGWGDGD